MGKGSNKLPIVVFSAVGCFVFSSARKSKSYIINDAEVHTINIDYPAIYGLCTQLKRSLSVTTFATHCRSSVRFIVYFDQSGNSEKIDPHADWKQKLCVTLCYLLNLYRQSHWTSVHFFIMQTPFLPWSLN